MGQLRVQKLLRLLLRLTVDGRSSRTAKETNIDCPVQEARCGGPLSKAVPGVLSRDPVQGLPYSRIESALRLEVAQCSAGSLLGKPLAGQELVYILGVRLHLSLCQGSRFRVAHFGVDSGRSSKRDDTLLLELPELIHAGAFRGPGNARTIRGTIRGEVHVFAVQLDLAFTPRADDVNLRIDLVSRDGVEGARILCLGTMVCVQPHCLSEIAADRHLLVSRTKHPQLLV